MSLPEIQAMLEQRVGLDLEVVGAETVTRAVKTRMQTCALTDCAEFLALVRGRPAEFEELLDEILVPETWFFRDRRPFEFIGNCVRQGRLPPGRQPPLRILSCPCSSGEEPYSIAMMLLDAGLTDSEFSIEAVDISRRALCKARRAVYGPNSFRGDGLAFRDRYFRQTGEGYVLADDVRAAVSFRQGNILAVDFPAQPGTYDIVFCRNLLIYLQRRSRERVIRLLRELLVEGGILVVGHAELMQAAASGLVIVQEPGAFALRRETIPHTGNAASIQEVRSGMLPVARVRERPHVPRRTSPALETRRQGSDVHPFRTGALGQPRAPGSVDSKGAASDLLELAVKLANSGQLEEAGNVCRQALDTDAAHPQVHFLLGVIAQASNRDTHAEEHFRKAIYLQADYHEALVSMALLLEQRGDRTAAERFRKRAERSRSEQSPVE